VAAALPSADDVRRLRGRSDPFPREILPMSAAAGAGESQRWEGWRMKELPGQLLRNDDGQDLIEYGLLGGLVAALSLVGFPQIVDNLRDLYNKWNTDVNGLSIPAPPE
jgi:Flp pilus assembly pilin Flp